VRLIVATHPAPSTSKPPIGVLRDETVYELFLTTANPSAFTCADVLDLYLHRGSFETVLADEDQEQDTDRWCSHAPCGQECWQILNQWLWNLRLDFGTAPLSLSSAFDRICSSYRITIGSTLRTNAGKASRATLRSS
jgi:hypothetical protein